MSNKGQHVRPWTTSEVQILRRFATEGAEAVSALLSSDGRPGRSVQAVQWKASRLGISLRRDPHPALCPFCGRSPIREGTAAARHGMCVPCWQTHLADLKREQRDIERTWRDYEAEKAKLKRQRRKQ